MAADVGGCYTYRVRIPHDALYQYGVIWQPYCFLPREIDNPNSFEVLVNMVSSFDLMIIQRCYLLEVVEKVVQACRLLGIPVLFETDDDYLSILPSNPAYFAITQDQSLFSRFMDLQNKASQLQANGKGVEAADCIKRANEMIPALMESRQQGLNNYIQILKMVDGVTVSTQELANTIYPYNKNVRVFGNNVQFCFPWRLDAPESAFIQEIDGKRQVQVYNRLGLYTIPKFAIMDSNIKGIKSHEIKKTPRVGYSCTASHWGEDWNTVIDGINKVSKKLQNKAWWILLGDNDQRFSKSITGDPGRVLTLQGGQYELYIQNLGNFDIGLAPLASTGFNASKSEVKFLEYASWGICPILPHFIAYGRAARDNDTCLMYRNEREFEEKLELAITNSKVREEIGQNALKYVINERLSWLPKNTEPRYNFYKEMVERVPRLKIYPVNKELEAAI